MRFKSLLVLFAAMPATTPALASLYDTVVLRDRPVLYLKMAAPQSSATEPDLAGGDNNGRYYPQTRHPKKTTMPNGDTATQFDGVSQYLEVRSASVLSVKPGRALTIEAWMRPDTLQFRAEEGDGYVHWAGKGEAGNHEYALRMYSKTNSAHRPNRISGYAFNPQGGLGSGSYFQDALTKGTWIYVAVVIDARTSPGSIAIYRDGELRKTTSLAQFGVTPQPGNAPLRIATRDLGSFFQGAVGKFAVYAKALSQGQLRAHYARMKP